MEILNYHEQPPGGSLIAVFSVQTQWATFHRIKLFRTRNGGFTIGLPSYAEENREGKTIWHPYVEFSQEKEREFKKGILDIVKAMVK